jgi:plasmid maintenance system antidote protein VapI
VLTRKFYHATFTLMNKAETAQLLGITRQHLDYVLAGSRNFSFQTAKKAVVVVGGTLGLWLDRGRAKERKAAWRHYVEATKNRGEQ